MKKIILITSILLSGIYLINFISAISVNLNSGDILTSDTWGKISNITDKISVSGGDMKINGKIYISGKLCDSSGKCLGDVEYGTQENPGLSCSDILDNDNSAEDGIYWIKPDSNAAYQAYCDMTFDGGGWTLVHVSEELLKRWKFKGDGSCTQLNKDCNYKVNNTLVDNSDEVLFHTDSNYWAKLNYTNSGKWALAMKDDASRGAGGNNAGLTLIEDGPSLSRSEYWNQLWDSGAGIIFSNSSRYGVLALSYSGTSNDWMQNAPHSGNNHTINIFIRKGPEKIGETLDNPGKSCKHILDNGGNKGNGNYYIKPDGYAGSAFEVYCDMTTDGGGRTRYVNITGNYNASNAKNCIQTKTRINNSNLECFNPNQFNMAANNIMLKIGGQNYFKTLNGKVETNVTIANGSKPCTGHSQYMTVCSNASYVRPRLGLTRASIDLQVGGSQVGTQIYINYSHGGIFGPPPGNRRENSATKAEFFIK